MTTYKWTHIEDLPSNWVNFFSTELESLAPIWQEQSERVEKSGVLLEFNTRLCREWAIETGIIENLYSIDRGITQLLIERGIDASLIPHGATDRPAEQIVAILRDQEEALEGLFDFISQRRSLSTSYIKEIHAVLTRNQESVTAVNGAGRSIEVPLLRGEWKELPNNPTRQNGDVHEYCPPEHVASEMDKLIALHQEHVAASVPPDVEAAWLHHRFTQIHPFQDGNGRIARALASLIFVRARWFPLVIHRDIRADYIESLETADAGDIVPLTKLFAGIEKRSFLRALNISEHVLKEKIPIQQVISAAVEKLQAKFRGELEKQRQVFNIADSICEIARSKFLELKKNLDDQLIRTIGSVDVFVDISTDENSFWFKRQIIEIAKQHGYFADTRTYGSWARIKIREERQTEIVVSFHSVGTEFVGVIAASAFLEFRDRSDEGLATIDGPYALSRDLFQCSFNERQEVVTERFRGWLDEVMLAGVDQWRRQL